jgi:general nucleoside transport system ATP-binding protein
MTDHETGVHATTHGGGTPVLSMEGITKAFGDNVANDHIDLDLHHGEVHGLLGENGAGKSTLMKILYGLYGADSGRILLGGEPTTISTPEDAVSAGIGMVHQHFTLVPTLTVAENVVLGAEPRRGLLLDRAAAARAVTCPSAYSSGSRCSRPCTATRAS